MGWFVSAVFWVKWKGFFKGYLLTISIFLVCLVVFHLILSSGRVVSEANLKITGCFLRAEWVCLKVISCCKSPVRLFWSLVIHTLPSDDEKVQVVGFNLFGFLCCLRSSMSGFKRMYSISE